MSAQAVGKCDKCEKVFNYRLVHNGFNDSAYAYCDTCGMTDHLSGWFANIPDGAPLKLHEKISEEVERFLEQCECGGHFRRSANPRCPHCKQEISAESAARYIEGNAPGARKGWRWQCSWDGIYSIVIDGNSIEDNWKQEK